MRARIVKSCSPGITLCGDMLNRNTRDASCRYVSDLDQSRKRLRDARQTRHLSDVVSAIGHLAVTEHCKCTRRLSVRVCVYVASQWRWTSVPYPVSCQTVVIFQCDTVCHNVPEFPRHICLFFFQTNFFGLVKLVHRFGVREFIQHL